VATSSSSSSRDLPDSDEAGRVAAKIVAEFARALVQQADAAICRTKQSGRGRIVVAGA